MLSSRELSISRAGTAATGTSSSPSTRRRLARGGSTGFVGPELVEGCTLLPSDVSGLKTSCDITTNSSNKKTKTNIYKRRARRTRRRRIRDGSDPLKKLKKQKTVGKQSQHRKKERHSKVKLWLKGERVFGNPPYQPCGQYG